MALIPLSVGNHPLPFIGTTAVRLDSQPWFTAANVNVYAVSANGQSYAKNAGGSNQAFAPPTAVQFTPSTTALPNCYILEVKQTFSVDSALFGTPTVYTSTKTYTAFCGTDRPGTGSSVSLTRTALSTVDQPTADAAALQAATDAAVAALTCTVAANNADFISLAGPAGEAITSYNDPYPGTIAFTPTVAFQTGTGTVQLNWAGTWVSTGPVPANTPYSLRVLHPNNLAFTATLTLTPA